MTRTSTPNLDGSDTLRVNVQGVRPMSAPDDLLLLAPEDAKLREEIRVIRRQLLAALTRRATLNTEIAVAVAKARDAGCTWSVIGEAFGVTKQAAHERFAR